MQKEIDCPRCGGFWYQDLDEENKPYTCFHCCNGSVKCYEEPMENQHRKIAGYRELNQGEIDLMNKVKKMGIELEHLVEDISVENVDERWVNIARTHLQQGLMALTRAIAKPTFF